MSDKTLRPADNRAGYRHGRDETAKLECHYFTGMFSHERIAMDRLAADMIQMDSLEIHEAGHAVVQYALGFSCAGIAITEKRFIVEGARKASIACFSRKDRDRRVPRRIFKGILAEDTIAFGVTCVAGPAAERKFRLSQGLPMDMLGGTEGDHHAIESIAKTLDVKGGHDSWAYQEEVRRRAQAWMENGVIWSAVNTLAFCLGDTTWPSIEDDHELGTFTKTMPGHLARAIMRRAGVVPGMLTAAPAPALS
jgi:hypothetical protein